MAYRVDIVESRGAKRGLQSDFPSVHLMFDTATTALLRAVPDVCESVSHRGIGACAHVASKFLEVAPKGEVPPEGLRQVGRDVLSHAPRCCADCAGQA